MRVELLTDVSIDHRYEAGEIVDLPDDQARALITAGVAEAVEDGSSSAPEATAVNTATLEHPTVPRARRR